MKPINKKQRRTILLLLLYVAAVTASIFYTVTYFINNSTERGLLAFERFSEQITYRVSDHLSKYTEQLILLKSELMDRQITDLDDMQNILRRYVNDSALEGKKIFGERLESVLLRVKNDDSGTIWFLDGFVPTCYAFRNVGLDSGWTILTSASYVDAAGELMPVIIISVTGILLSFAYFYIGKRTDSKMSGNTM